MNLLGLIGGTSYESTIEYYQKINELVNARYGGLHSAPLFIYSLEFAHIEKLISRNDWSKIAQEIVPIARKMESFGCKALALCANTLHKIDDEIERVINIPLINIIDSTAKAIRIKLNQSGRSPNMSEIPGKIGINKVLLLGTKTTMEHDFYAARLNKKWDINAVVPDEKDRNEIDRIIYEELTRGKFLNKSREKIFNIIDKMREQGVQGVILACTELPLLIDDNSIRRFKTRIGANDRSLSSVEEFNGDIFFFDTLELHIRDCVDFIVSNCSG